MTKKKTTKNVKKPASKKKSTQLEKNLAKETKRVKKNKLLPFWRLAFEALKMYWSVKKRFFPLFITHSLLIVFVISDEIIQTSGQVFLGGTIALLISMMYIALLRDASKTKPNLSFESIFFDGPSQIMSFLTLLTLVTLQIIPFAFGALVFQIAIQANVAILLWEQVAFGILWFILAIPSMYWLSTTLMGLIVVTLPSVYPLQAWRAAKQLVKGFVFQVAWRVSIFLIICMALLIAAVIGAFAIGREVFALQLPNYFIAVLIPLFWGYVFALYRDLLGYEKKRS